MTRVEGEMMSILWSVVVVEKIEMTSAYDATTTQTQHLKKNSPCE